MSDYTKSDYTKANRNNDAFRREHGIGDFMTHLNQARRERINAYPLNQRISRKWSGR